MATLSGLFIYPVKSLRGIALEQAQVEARGLQFDRRWMIVDENGEFLTQRQLPQMATIGTTIGEDELILDFQTERLPVPLQIEGPRFAVRVWNDLVSAMEFRPARSWLSAILGRDCRLVWMPDDSKRAVSTDYARNGEITSFSDGFPFLILGQGSLDDLNLRLDEPVPADRFRTNFLFENAPPFDEDNWRRFRVGEVEFEVLKPCSRCIMTTTDQQSGQRQGKEPLRTLATYRQSDGKVHFSQNAVAHSPGKVRLGDTIEVLTRQN